METRNYTNENDFVLDDMELSDAINYFNTYDDDTEPMSITNDDDFMEACTINGDIPKGYADAILSASALLELERKTGLFTHMRSDDSGTGKSNIVHICDYKLKTEDREKIHSLKEALLREKDNEEKEMYHYLNECNSVTSNDEILNEINQLK
jgi:hypothetical protein